MRKLLSILLLTMAAALNAIASQSAPKLPPCIVLLYPSSGIQYIDVDNLHIQCDNIIKVNDYKPLYSNDILTPAKISKTCVPGRIPTFAFVGTISAVGTYTLYGAGAGIVTAGLVYICTNGNRKHTRQAIWGCVAGMALGGLVKWMSVR